MTKKNLWIIDKQKKFDRLSWTEKANKKFDSIEGFIERLELIQKAIDKQENISINEGNANFSIKDKNTQERVGGFEIDFKSLNELKKQINNYKTKEKQLLTGIIVIKTIIKLKSFVYLYDEKGNITKKWIDNPIEIKVSNTDYSGRWITLNSFSDVWMPDTYTGETEQDSCNNVELARLNIPILNTLLKNLIKELKIKFEVHEELSEKNKSMLIIQDDGIRMK